MNNYSFCFEVIARVKKKKHDRIAVIRRILEEELIPNQEALRDRLEEKGFSVSQSTLSRDLKYIGGFRAAVNNGKLAYTLPKAKNSVRSEDALGRAVQEFLTEMVPVGNFIVLRTFPGNAQSLCVVLDAAGMKEIAGTIAGDDTILVIAHTNDDIQKVYVRLNRMKV